MNNFNFIESIHELELDASPISVFAAILKPDFAKRSRIVSGKGITREQAFKSCLAEAAERWFAVYRKDIPGIWGSEIEMGPLAVSPNSLLLISDQQYATAPEWNLNVSEEHQLPKRLTSDQPIFWVEARSLTRDTHVLVPAAYCFLGYPHAREEGFPVPDSNGLAENGTLENCITRGLLELIERDAVSIWWYNRVRRPKLQTQPDNLTLLTKLKAWYQRQQRTLWLLDLTNDIQIPVAAAISCNAAGTDLSFGFAAGWTNEEAAQSALCELIQFEATKRLTLGRDLGSSNFIAWSREACIDSNPFLRPAATTRVSHICRTRDIQDLIHLLWQKQIEVVSLRMTKASSPFEVVRVIAPGLRPLWPRFAAGRLYSVPAKLGWCTELVEDELNPTSIIY